MASDSSTLPMLKIKEEGSPGSSEVAPFISKVWEIVNRFKELVQWSENGKTFIVLDESRFAKEILPNYFKHNNFNSFVRQLNLYGFRKVAKPDQGALLKSSNVSVEFWHANFRRDHPELLYLVQRRPVSVRTGSDEKNPIISQVMNDIHSMKGKQSSIDSMLEELRRENSHLKQNITLLKEKNKYQDRLLNKIIHFIIHLIYKGTLPTKRGRLMLTDGADEQVPFNSLSKRPRLLESPGTPPPSYSVQSPLPPPIPISPSLNSANTVSVPQSSLYDNNDFPISEDTALSGDEFLADLFNPPLSSSLPPSSLPPSLLPSSATPISPYQTPSSQQVSTAPVVPYVNPHKEKSPLSLATSQLDTQQQVLDSLHDVLPDQLSIDPLILSEFINSSDFVLPEYDIVDTARLLESISSDPQSDVPHADSVQKTAVVPFTSNMLPLPYNSASTSGGVEHNNTTTTTVMNNK